jgi:hypothetical protein
MSVKSNTPDPQEALFAATAGAFLAVVDALDAAGARAAVESLQEYAEGLASQNPLGADLCRGLAEVAASGLST